MKSEADEKSRTVQRLAARARRRKGGGADAARFVAQLYGDVAEGDLSKTGDGALLDGAMSTWGWLRSRKRGRPKIRVFNPDKRTDGWTSPHTVVDIVNDDMPFLVDSVTAEINRQDLSIHLTVHPIVRVERDRTGRLTRLRENGVDGAAPESVMHFEITEMRQPAAMERLREGLEAVLDDVRAAVEDPGAMRRRLADIVARLEDDPPPVADAEIAEARSFLRWLLASDIPDDPSLIRDVPNCFPRPLRDRFEDLILRHRLRREISATCVVNSTINRAGPFRRRDRTLVEGQRAARRSRRGRRGGAPRRRKPGSRDAVRRRTRNQGPG